MSLSDKATYLLRYLPRFNMHNVEKSPFTKKVSFEVISDSNFYSS